MLFRSQHPQNPGGVALGGVGPVAEGFVALLIGVGGLALICFWIGERSPSDDEEDEHAEGGDDPDPASAEAYAQSGQEHA